MKNELMYIVIHCTATPEGRDVTAEEIVRWHTATPPKGRGWSRPGYSDLIKLDGSLINLRDYNQDDKVDEQEMTWGAKGINGVSRHIVYAGGMSADMSYSKNTLNAKQQKTLETYLRFMILRYPFIRIAGHNQFARKACPSFYVPDLLVTLKFPEQNIYRERLCKRR